MSEHNHHHHHKKDDASRFKEKSLNSIVFRRKFNKWLKIIMTAVAVLMMCVAVIVYLID